MGRKYQQKPTQIKKQVFWAPIGKAKVFQPPFFRGKLAVSFREGNVLTSLNGALNVRRYLFCFPPGQRDPTEFKIINVPMPKKALTAKQEKKDLHAVEKKSSAFFFVFFFWGGKKGEVEKSKMDSWIRICFFGLL